MPFKFEIRTDEITSRSGLAAYTEFSRALGVDRLVEKHMPLPVSIRDKKLWMFIAPLMLMIYGGGRHSEEFWEIRNDRAFEKADRCSRYTFHLQFWGFAQENGQRSGALWNKKDRWEDSERCC